MTRRARSQRRAIVRRGDAQLIGSLAALSPRHWYADAFANSGSNLSTWTNLGSAGGNLAVSLGTIAAPAADGAMGGKATVALTGTQHLTSSLAASEFRFLHDGTGFNAFLVVRPTANPGTTQGLWSTVSTATGFSQYRSASNTLGAFLSNSTTGLVNTAGGALTVDTNYLIESSFATAATPRFFHSINGTSAFTSSPAGAPEAGDPGTTLIVGGITSGSLRCSARIGALIIFDRVLQAAERSTVYAYCRRYGL